MTRCQDGGFLRTRDIARYSGTTYKVVSSSIVRWDRGRGKFEI